ncbi:MAG TPA: hypothetical protein VHQ48_05510 [Bradyrhizobium sp.]|nr:hypothetical protein [Bradyrhizobium sp.]
MPTSFILEHKKNIVLFMFLEVKGRQAPVLKRGRKTNDLVKGITDGGALYPDCVRRPGSKPFAEGFPPQSAMLAHKKKPRAFAQGLSSRRAGSINI